MERASLTEDQINSFAFQMLPYQEAWENSGLSLEDPLALPRQLFSTFGESDARVIVTRMMEIRRDPEARLVAEAADRASWEELQRQHGIDPTTA